MHHFRRIQGRLHCEGVDLARLAARHGTPTYVYSASTLEEHFLRLSGGLTGLDHRICFAVKANPHIAILRLFAKLGAGFDLVSGGELRRVLAAGADVRSSVFAGVGKTEAEIALALEQGIFSIHVESEPELERIDRVARRLGLKAPVAIRVNPDVDAHTHAKITTGKSENKFGIPLTQAHKAYEFAARLKHVEVKGVQMHIGSQITEVSPFVEAVERLAEFADQHRERFGFRYVSVGGGIGIVYRDALASGAPGWWGKQPAEARPLTTALYGKAIVPILQPLGLPVLLEPGRMLVGNAGVLLTKVEYLKRGQGRNFLIVDAGMNDLVRPAMYDAYHEFVPCVSRPGARRLVADIVGPICESGDCFGKDRVLPSPKDGDILAIMSAGAYGAAMASRYNSRSLPAEVLVRGKKASVITERESFAHLISQEKLA